jgi:hypothetical protein
VSQLFVGLRPTRFRTLLGKPRIIRSLYATYRSRARFTAALLLLYCCFTAALLLLYCCFTAALLLLCFCFTTAFCFFGRGWKTHTRTHKYTQEAARVSGGGTSGKLALPPSSLDINATASASTSASPSSVVQRAALLLLCCCFAAALLVLYCFVTGALLLLYC